MSAGETYYRFESLNGCLTITLLPELNDKQWADIERVGTEIVDRISAAPSPKVLVDLTPLSYMGSAMVALIVRLYKTVNSRGGKMAVVNQHELVFEVLKLAGLTKLWTIVPNRQEAYTSLGIKASAPSSTGGGLQTGGMGLVAAGVIGTVGTLVGLALQFSSSPMVPQKIALLIEIAFAFVGLGAGMFLLNQAGSRRNLGIAFLAICVLAVLGGIVAAPQEAAAKGPAAGAKTTSASAEAKATEAPAAPAASTPAPTVAATPVSAPAAADKTPPDDDAPVIAKPGKLGRRGTAK
ncbi:MAG TPA: STAS domain-containing protein [Planctomycetaceae bacterium]|nr:STAS domain-containing protein [Planctomycetaceae bacterium]